METVDISSEAAMADVAASTRRISNSGLSEKEKAAVMVAIARTTMAMSGCVSILGNDAALALYLHEMKAVFDKSCAAFGGGAP